MILKLKTAALLIIFGILCATAVAVAVQNKGAPEILLDAGSKGKVFFPHHEHQNNLVDCTICHSMFPQKPGIIVDFIRQGKLEKKQVMNHCRGCHRNLSQRGEKAGPTSCNKCHVK